MKSRLGSILNAVVFVILLLTNKCYGLPNGAPIGACSTLEPIHAGINPQASESPYKIDVETFDVKGGESVTITLSTTSEAFGGFLVIAVQKGFKDNDLKAVGRMLPSDDTTMKTLECNGPNGIGLTHKDTQPKKNIQFRWQAPNVAGKYNILATFAKDYSTYWPRVKSAQIRVTFDENTSDEPDHVTSTQAEEQNTPFEVQEQLKEYYEDCGKTWGCFATPEGCISARSACKMFASWQVAGEKYKFRIAGEIPGKSSTGHVSIGLSLDGFMGDDSVVGCVMDGSGAVQPRSYYNFMNSDGLRDNSAYSNDLFVGLTGEKNGKAIEGWVFCEYTRGETFIPPNNTLAHPFNMKEEDYYILLARAGYIDTNRETNFQRLGKHGPGDFVASGEDTHLAIASILGASKNTLIKLHGSLMIIAWIMTSSLGIFVARYYKQTHTDKNPFDKAFWFIIHVGSMFVTIGITFLAVIFIVIEAGGYSSVSTQVGQAHPILGFVLTGLCAFQLIIGLLRPHPGTSKRPIFNWAHWLAGNVGHIIGVICLFLAVEVPKAGLKDFPWLMILGLFVLFHILMHITLSIHTVWADKQMEVTNKFRGFSVGPMKPSKPDEAPGTVLRTGLLLLYILGIISFAVALIYYVATTSY